MAQQQQQGTGGYDFGLSGSSSSGASQSGAIRSGGGGNYGGTNYGPGSLILTDQSGSIGASAGGINWLWVAGATIGGLWLFWLIKSAFPK